MNHDIIFLSLEDWDDIWRRNQFVCATLARRHPQMKILFVGIPRHAPHLLKAGKIGPLLANPTTAVPGYPNIFITRPLRLGPESTEWGLRLNQRLYRRHLLKTMRRLDLKDPILWINPHNAYHVVGRIPHAATIYDITDDWTTLTQKKLDRDRTIAADELLCRTADAVIVCSQKLLELKRPLVPAPPRESAEACERLALIPNGVDADHYASVLDATSTRPIPDAIARLPRPIYGYTGTIHPDRIDLELLAHVAATLAGGARNSAAGAGNAPPLGGSFVLIGPSHLLPQHRALLPGNVHLLPAIPYAQIPDYMRAFDVAITPHRVTPFTESLNPIKLWEYLAAGKPIVSTDVAGFRDYPQHVRIARTAADFSAALQGAITEARSPQAPQYAAARQAEARKHSWHARVDQIESVLEAALSRRQGESFAAPAPQTPVPSEPVTT